MVVFSSRLPAAADKQETKVVKKIIWISFDLGVTGDYEGIYTWLDSWGAVECGDSFAYIKAYDFRKDLLAELREDIKQTVRIDKRTRIYVVREVDGEPKGRFLIGGRKNAPWSGYAPTRETG